MKNFKAVSMDCNQEQFESMREELIELGCVMLDNSIFEAFPLLVNNLNGIAKKVENISPSAKLDYSRTYIGAFDKEAFLQACGKDEEVNKSGWYISTNGSRFLMYADYEKNTKFGFQPDGSWFVSRTSSFFNGSKATSEQVLQRLTEEAEKRGYKGGVIIDSGGRKRLASKRTELSKNNSFSMGGRVIMVNGIWADIAPNEIEVVEPEVKACGLANEIINNRKEQDKKLDSAVKSRNMYKYLYEKEKARAVFMEDKIKKDIAYYSELNDENNRLQGICTDSKKYCEAITKDYDELFKSWDDMENDYKKENQELKKKLSKDNFYHWLLMCVVVIYLISNLV